jgi:cobaltochelatase CobT
VRRFFELFAGKPQKPAPAYRAYTRDFDRVVRGQELDAVLGPLSRIDKEAARETWLLFNESLQGWRTRANLAGLAASERVLVALSTSDLNDTVVSILVDQSGSMKGQRILLAAAAADVGHDFLTHLGCAVEVLGFTTTSWRGGESRRRWRRRFRPKAPGRLCDLLHVVYRATGDPVAASLTPMLRPGLLKENVDGEALLWAASRLRSSSKKRRLLIIVSDGAPVDDSTLQANDPGYLERHLRAVISELEASDDVRLAAVGIGYDLGLYYSRSTVVQTPEDLGVAMVDLLERMLLDESGATSPTAAG